MSDDLIGRLLARREREKEEEESKKKKEAELAASWRQDPRITQQQPRLTVEDPRVTQQLPSVSQPADLVDYQVEKRSLQLEQERESPDDIVARAIERRRRENEDAERRKRDEEARRRAEEASERERRAREAEAHRQRVTRAPMEVQPEDPRVTQQASRFTAQDPRTTQQEPRFAQPEPPEPLSGLRSEPFQVPDPGLSITGSAVTDTSAPTTLSSTAPQQDAVSLTEPIAPQPPQSEMPGAQNVQQDFWQQQVAGLPNLNLPTGQIDITSTPLFQVVSRVASDPKAAQEFVQGLMPTEEWSANMLRSQGDNPSFMALLINDLAKWQQPDWAQHRAAVGIGAMLAPFLWLENREQMATSSFEPDILPPSWRMANWLIDKDKEERRRNFQGNQTPLDKAVKAMQQGAAVSRVAGLTAGAVYIGAALTGQVGKDVMLQNPIYQGQIAAGDAAWGSMYSWDGIVQHLHITPPNQLMKDAILGMDGYDPLHFGSIIDMLIPEDSYLGETSFMSHIQPIGAAINVYFGPWNFRTSETFWTDIERDDNGWLPGDVNEDGERITNTDHWTFRIADWDNLMQAPQRAYAYAERERIYNAQFRKDIEDLAGQPGYEDAVVLNLLQYSDSKRKAAALEMYIDSKEGWEDMLVTADQLEAQGQTIDAALMRAKAFQLRDMPVEEIVMMHQNPLGEAMGLMLGDPTNAIGLIGKPLSKIQRIMAGAEELTNVSAANRAQAWRQASQEATNYVNRLYTGQITDESRFINNLDLMKATPETNAVLDADVTMAWVDNLINSASSNEDVRRILEVVTSPQATQLFEGDGIQLAKNLGVRENLATVLSGGAVAHDEFLKRMPILEMARDKLLSMKSLRGWDTKAIQQEMYDVLTQASQQYHGVLGLMELPFGASSITVEATGTGKHFLAYWDEAGKMIRSSVPDSIEKIQSQHKNLTKLLKDVQNPEHPVSMGIDFAANLVREVISTGNFAGAPMFHTIQNAMTGVFMSITQGGWSWMNHSSIFDYYGRKYGKFISSPEVNRLAGTLTTPKGATIVETVAGKQHIRGWLDKLGPVGETMGKLIDWGYSIPYGSRQIPIGSARYSVPVSENSFRLKVNYATFSRYFNQHWKDWRVQANQELVEAGFDPQTANRLISQMYDWGVDGSRETIVEGVRRVLSESSLQISFGELNIPEEVISLTNRFEINKIFGMPISDLEKFDLISDIFDKERLYAADILRMAPNTPNVFEWSRASAAAEGAKIYDSLVEAAKRAGVTAGDAKRQAKTIAGQFEKVWDEGFAGIHNDLFSLKENPNVGSILTDLYNEMTQLRFRFREQADDLARAAHQSGNKPEMWKQKFDGNVSIWSQYIEEAKTTINSYKDILRNQDSISSYVPKTAGWQEVIARYTGFDPDSWEQLRKFDGSTKQFELFGRIINAERARIDNAFSRVAEALTRVPSTEGLDIMSSLWRWSDAEGAKAAAFVENLRAQRSRNALSAEEYARQSSAIWRQYFDNVVTYADAAIFQIVEHGVVNNMGKNLVFNVNGERWRLIAHAPNDLWEAISMKTGETRLFPSLTPQQARNATGGYVPREMVDRFNKLITDGLTDFTGIVEEIKSVGGRKIPVSVLVKWRPTPEQVTIGRAGLDEILNLAAKLSVSKMDRQSSGFINHIRNIVRKELKMPDLPRIEDLPVERWMDALEALYKRVPPDTEKTITKTHHYDSSIARALGLPENTGYEDLVAAVRQHFSNSFRSTGARPFDYGDAATSTIEQINLAQRKIEQHLIDLKSGSIPNQLTPQQINKVIDVADKAAVKFDEILEGARITGDEMTNWVMLDYKNRKRFDKYLSWFMGYWYFLTRMPSRYADSALRHPYAMTGWFRHQRAMEEETMQEELPPRFGGSVPNVFAEKFGGAEQGTERVQPWTEIWFPGEAYFNPPMYQMQPDEASQMERSITNYQRQFWLPHWTYANSWFFDQTDPLKNGEKRTDTYSLYQMMPLARLVHTGLVSTGSQPLSQSGNFFTRGGAYDPGQQADAVNRLAMEQGADENTVLYAIQWVKNYHDGVDPMTNVPEEQQAAVEELATEGIRMWGSEQFVRNLSNFFLRLPTRTYTPQMRELDEAVNNWFSVGYDESSNPLGSKADQRAILEENPYVPTSWTARSLYPGSDREEPYISARRNEFYDKRDQVYQSMYAEQIKAIEEDPDISSDAFYDIGGPFYEQIEELAKEYEDVPQLQGTTRGMNPAELAMREIEDVLRYKPPDRPEYPGDDASEEELGQYFMDKAAWDKARYDYIEEQLARRTAEPTQAVGAPDYLTNANPHRELIALALEGLYASDLARQFGMRFAPDEVFEWNERRVFERELTNAEFAQIEENLRQRVGDEGVRLFEEYKAADDDERKKMREENPAYGIINTIAYNTRQFDEGAEMFGPDWLVVYENFPKDYPDDDASKEEVQAFYATQNRYRLQYPQIDQIRLWYNGKTANERQEFFDKNGHGYRDYGVDYAEADAAFAPWGGMEAVTQAQLAAAQASLNGNFVQWGRANPQQAQLYLAYQEWLKQDGASLDELEARQAAADEPAVALEDYTGPRPFGSDREPVVPLQGTVDPTARPPFVRSEQPGIPLSQASDPIAPELPPEPAPAIGRPGGPVPGGEPPAGLPVPPGPSAPPVGTMGEPMGTVIPGERPMSLEERRQIAAEEMEAAGLPPDIIARVMQRQQQELESRPQQGPASGPPPEQPLNFWETGVGPSPGFQPRTPEQIEATRQRLADEGAASNEQFRMDRRIAQIPPETRFEDFSVVEGEVESLPEGSLRDAAQSVVNAIKKIDGDEDATPDVDKHTLLESLLSDSDTWNKFFSDEAIAAAEGVGGSSWARSHNDVYYNLTTAEKVQYMLDNPDFAEYYNGKYPDRANWWVDYSDGAAMNAHWDVFRDMTTAEKVQYMLDNPDFAAYYNEKYPDSANWWLNYGGGSGGSSFRGFSFGGGGGGRRQEREEIPQPARMIPYQGPQRSGRLPEWRPVGSADNRAWQQFMQTLGPDRVRRWRQ